MDFKKWRILLAGVIVLTAAGTLFAVTETDRYGAIVRRNAFNLREPEPPKPPPEPPPTIKVNLTGITTLLSNKRVFLLIQEQGKQPESKMLSEGDRDGQIEVISINEVEGSVKIKIGDKESVLTFEKDGIKPPTTPVNAPGTPGAPGTPPVPGVPGVPSIPGTVPSGSPITTGVTPSPGSSIGTSFNQPGGVSAMAATGGTSLPTRPIRSDVPSAPMTSISGLSGVPTGNTAVTVATPGGQGVTLRMGGTPSQPKLQPNWPPENPPSSLEEAIILHEAIRIKHEKEIQSGILPPLPAGL
jgi:hypothetical protein